MLSTPFASTLRRNKKYCISLYPPKTVSLSGFLCLMIRKPYCPTAFTEIYRSLRQVNHYTVSGATKNETQKVKIVVYWKHGKGWRFYGTAARQVNQLCGSLICTTICPAACDKRTYSKKWHLRLYRKSPAQYRWCQCKRCHSGHWNRHETFPYRCTHFIMGRSVSEKQRECAQAKKR